MRNLLIAAAVVVMLVPPVSGQIPAPAAPKVQLRFEDGGTVTLSATGATIREVLAEWTRKGGTVFVGAERLPATPLTLQYDHRPEAEVAASLLRNAAGFVIGPRREGASSASSIEIVVILAASTASAANNPPPPLYPNGETAPSPGRAGQPAPDAPPPPADWPRGPGGASTPVIPAPPLPAVPVVPDPLVAAPKPTTAPPTTAGSGRGGGGALR